MRLRRALPIHLACCWAIAMLLVAALWGCGPRRVENTNDSLAGDFAMNSKETVAGPAAARIEQAEATLANKAIETTWQGRGRTLVLAKLRDLVNGVDYSIGTPAFVLELGDGTTLSAMDLKPAGPLQIREIAADPKSSSGAGKLAGKMLECRWDVPAKQLKLTWRAILRDGTHHIRQELVIEPREPGTVVRTLTLCAPALPNAQISGSVRGSPVTTDTLFFGIEHPLAVSSTKKMSDLAFPFCSFSRQVPLPAGQPWSISSVIGVAQKGQLRRAFNEYLESERAHPYRPFLHYNSWYDLNIGRPGNRMEEAQALKAIHDIGTEMTKKRGVPLASYVMDDGWDSHVDIWNFHDGFPKGFANITREAGEFGSGIGVWMSPWGGYGKVREERLENGAKLGFEIKGRGFSVAGPKYGQHFLRSCRRMVRDYHVNFFKFDGMGGGLSADGEDSMFADDMDAIFNICRELRREDPDLFISATVGTWPSPFWLRYADSIFRQEDDTGFAGVGPKREQWITFRDSAVYHRVVQRGKLYPLSSLMLHGIVIGEVDHPLHMEKTDETVRHEIRSFFGSGTCIQELYISPQLVTPQMWDDLAEAAKWAKKNAACLVDSHWIGGDPAKLEVYGFAAWQPGKGIVTLRNPSDKSQEFSLDVGKIFELPEGAAKRFTLKSPWSDEAAKPAIHATVGAPLSLRLTPFEVLTLEAQ